MTDRDDELNPQQTAAIVALMTARTLQEAAARVDVGERTLRRWLSTEPFRRALRREQRAVLAAAMARLQESATKAIDTLEAIMEQGDAPAAARVTAARTLLELAHERLDMEDLADRVEAVEAANRSRS